MDERSSTALLVSQSLDPLLKWPEEPTDNKTFDPRLKLVLTQILTIFGADSREPKLG